MHAWNELGVLVLLTLLSGVFTGAEIAMLSVRTTRLRELADHGSRSAEAALRLRGAPESLLATLQIAITVIAASTAVFGGAKLEAPIARFLERLGLGAPSAEGWAFALVVVLVSYLSLVLGELVPKSLALRSPERFALGLAGLLVALSWLSRPLVWLLTASSNVVLRPFRDRTNFTESRLSPDELQQLVEESAAAGALDPGAAEVTSRSLDLAKLRAHALMTPRPRVVSIEIDATQDEVLRVLQAAPHARYLVHEKEPEQILGYVLARELYDSIARRTFGLRERTRAVSFFPETTPAIEVLRALQAAKQKLAVLVEVEGGVAGVITIEDIAEVVLGDILDEHETPRRLAWKDADGAVIAVGEAPLHEVERLLGHDLPEVDVASTISGLLMHARRGVPAVGERIGLGPYVEAEILETGAMRVAKLRLRATGAASSATEPLRHARGST